MTHSDASGCLSNWFLLLNQEELVHNKQIAERLSPNTEITVNLSQAHSGLFIKEQALS